MSGPDEDFSVEEKRKTAIEDEREKREGREAIETFSFAKASRLVEPLGAIQFAAWDALRLVDDVRISAIYASDPPPLDWKDPIQRALENDLEKERPKAKHALPRRMVALRRRLRALREMVDQALVEEAIP